MFDLSVARKVRIAAYAKDINKTILRAVNSSPLLVFFSLSLSNKMKVALFGGMGALLNCVLALHSSSLSLAHIIDELLVQPFTAMKTLLLLPAALGFLIGTVTLLFWSFLRAIVLRSLLQYNGWFLKPKSPLNKIWYLLMLFLLGRKNLGAGNYQKFLPSLPVPPLTKTCKRYLQSVQPLLTDEQFRKTEKVVNDFKAKEGRKLQMYLTLRSWTHRNWLSQWWEEFIYFRQRTSISHNSNYFCLGARRPPTPHQLDRAASALYQTVMFVKKIKSGRIKNMTAQDLVPFCMEANMDYTNSSRIPGKTVDRIINFDHNKIHHTVVMRQGKFYIVQVTDKDGRIYPPTLLKKQLERIVEMAGDEKDETGVMTFTALPREDWADIRKRLEEDPVNKKSLELIDSSYSIVVLDTESPDLDDFREKSRHMFHGNVYNRWFDKSFSIIVCANGVIGSNVEHSRLDATVACQGWEYMLQHEEYDDNGRVLQLSEDGFPRDTQPEELKWNLESFTDDLSRSKDHLRSMIADSDLVVVCPSYGKSVPKKCRLSPDGWFQMALQLTYYRIYHKLVLTYESATTRLYYKGRTETIRPVSMQSKAFVEAMDDSSISVEKKRELLKEAIKYQEQYKFEAMRGMGVDRHLFGLYIVAKWLKMDPMPEIFEDEAFQLKFTLSTSQTPTQCIKEKDYDDEKRTIVGGFGTVTDNGYGVSYIISGEETVYFSIHSKNSCTETSSERFGEELKKSFEDMREIFS
ncbi:PREDICTED: carnitine O-palmitoyltransferase 1, muscle isoform-like isoform X1 [Amphimedon queenslandica]|uniref:Choline/carnitine acyltransferase domain-containing protein n=3 Tax=Amphimedon queenslandica TaxID=400682 RepID=A0AAN0IZ30_AMPQE|nr:PREDICTED: carnitine O-palmitoyltransferase 1, muscle isoform-like isoform X1 [Amphimedon queenslandica]|eukprot:XP_019849708.1 PREDICTED: carnitine O-palmitoyltransferase 1, muscle isoform-like isoform X1 [Amphimedon queenslandica]